MLGIKSNLKKLGASPNILYCTKSLTSNDDTMCMFDYCLKTALESLQPFYVILPQNNTFIYNILV